MIIFSTLNIQAHDYYDYSHGERHSCTSDQENTPTTCVPWCRVRRDDESCMQYHSDYCGVNPVCVENCRVRRDNGDCMQYHEDSCSSN